MKIPLMFQLMLFLITFTIPFRNTPAPEALIPTEPIMPSISRFEIELTDVDCAFVILTESIYAFKSLSNTLTPA